MATFNSLKAAKGQLDVQGPGVAFAALPAAPTLGMIRVVNNATETEVGKAPNGGGTAKVLVWYNGTSWRIIGGTAAA
jgi:hypothetical protein